jgi:hypothetical protein
MLTEAQVLAMVKHRWPELPEQDAPDAVWYPRALQFHPSVGMLPHSLPAELYAQAVDLDTPEHQAYTTACKRTADQAYWHTKATIARAVLSWQSNAVRWQFIRAQQPGYQPPLVDLTISYEPEWLGESQPWIVRDYWHGQNNPRIVGVGFETMRQVEEWLNRNQPAYYAWHYNNNRVELPDRNRAADRLLREWRSEPRGIDNPDTWTEFMRDIDS